MLNRQVVLITGAAGRIGSAIARGAVAQGAQAVLVDVNHARLSALTATLNSASVLALNEDATTVQGVKAVIEASRDRFGRLDAAIHSAYPRSSNWGARFEDLEPHSLGEDLSKQLGGAILFSQQVLTHFKRHGGGNLIHISSIQGVAAPKFEHYEGTEMNSPVEYAAIKAGLIAVTRYLAKYCRGQNIRVNCLSPGGILDEQPGVFLERYRYTFNLKGMLDAADLVGAALFLLSDASRYITGQNLIVDDGWTL